VVTAAVLLHGAVARATEADTLAEWSRQRLEQLMAATPPALVAVNGALLVYAALLLAKAGTIAPPADLDARLDALSETHKDNVWLWAAAYDVFAQPVFQRRALDAAPSCMLIDRGFSLIRLYQLTGNVQVLAGASAVFAGFPNDRLAASDVALLVAELKAPERAMLPPFQVPPGMSV
jgi:hypothetical protein